MNELRVSKLLFILLEAPQGNFRKIIKNRCDDKTMHELQNTLYQNKYALEFNFLCAL